VEQLTADTNTPGGYIPTILRFNYIVDMVSNNQRSTARTHTPITFTYFVSPPSPFSINGVTGIITTFLEDPRDWFINNWFLIVLLVIAVIVISLVYKNFNSGGGSNVNIFPGTDPNRWGGM